MQKFNIGDIVKMKENENILFIIVDVADFSEKGVVDIDYEMMQVFPIQRNSKYANVSQADIMIHAETDTKDSEILLRFIQKDREKAGWFGVPDFAHVIIQNLRAIDKAKGVKPPMRKNDSIRYDLLDTIDECLDAMNDLTTLHEMFGDEAYLQLKDLVQERIKKLQK